MPALAGLGGYLGGRAGTRVLASGPLAGLGENAEVVASLATFVATYMLARTRIVRRLAGRNTDTIVLGVGIATAQSVLSRLLPDSIKAPLGLSGLLGGMGAMDVSNFRTPYDDLALSAYERVPTAGLAGMGAYERVPTAGMEGIDEHLAGLEGAGIGTAERMIDVAEAAAGIGASDVVEAAAGVGRYVPQLSGFSAYERVPTAGFGGMGAVVGVKKPGIVKSLIAAVSGRRAPPTIVHPATPGAVPCQVTPTGLVPVAKTLTGLTPSMFGQELASGAKPTIEPIDRMKAIHMQSPSDAGAIPGSSLDSYAGIFSGFSAVGTPMDPY